VLIVIIITSRSPELGVLDYLTWLSVFGLLKRGVHGYLIPVNYVSVLRWPGKLFSGPGVRRQLSIVRPKIKLDLLFPDVRLPEGDWTAGP